MCQRKHKTLFAIVTLQVEDSIIVGTEEFFAREEDEFNAFHFKPKIHAGNNRIMFNSIELVEIKDNTIKMTQAKKILKLKIPTNEGL